MPVQLHSSIRCFPMQSLPQTDPEQVPQDFTAWFSKSQQSINTFDKVSDITAALKSSQLVLSEVLALLHSLGDDPLIFPPHIQSIFLTLLGKCWTQAYKSVLESLKHTTKSILNDILPPEIDSTSTYANSPSEWYIDASPDGIPAAERKVRKVINTTTPLHLGNVYRLVKSDPSTVLLWANYLSVPEIAGARGGMLMLSSKTFSPDGPKSITMPTPSAAEIHQGMSLHTFSDTLVSTLVHELMHIKSPSCIDIKLCKADLPLVPTWVRRKFNDDGKLLDFGCYGLPLCKVLALTDHSAESAPRNAETLALLFILLWLAGRHPKWDFLSGKAQLRSRQDTEGDNELVRLVQKCSNCASKSLKSAIWRNRQADR